MLGLNLIHVSKKALGNAKSQGIRSHSIDLVFTGYSSLSTRRVNTLRPRQNGRHFADDTFNRISVDENVRILIKFSLKFVPKGPINNMQALVQIMAWRRPGDHPLSEPVMVSLLTHMCITRPNELTYFPLVPHICISISGQHWFG